MDEDALEFSRSPSPSWKDFKDKNKFPVANYLKMQGELISLQKERAYLESHGQLDLLPKLHNDIKKLEKMLADAPPDPLLPPPTPLIKVTGELEAFNSRHIPHYFDAKTYPPTHEYFSRQQKLVARAAVVVAAGGQGVAAQGMLLEEDRLSRLALCVTGRINGKRFSGWLGYTFCQPGERVELIVSPIGDEYLVYALAKPKERSITMTPGCFRGKKQAQWAGSCFWFGIFMVCIAVLLVTAVVVEGVAVLLNPDFYAMLITCLGIGGIPILGPAFYSIWKRHPFPQEELAEEIFTVMGWKNVADINLVKLNRRRKQQWKRTGKPEASFKDQSHFLYSGWGMGFYYF